MILASQLLGQTAQAAIYFNQSLLADPTRNNEDTPAPTFRRHRHCAAKAKREALSLKERRYPITDAIETGRIIVDADDCHGDDEKQAPATPPAP